MHRVAFAIVVLLGVSSAAPSGAQELQAPPDGTSTENTPDAIDSVRRSCEPDHHCPALPRLFPLLQDPLRGAEAAVVLGLQGDVRAIAPLTYAVAYGPTAAIQDAATQSLRILSLRDDGMTALARIAAGDPDPAIRQVAADVIGRTVPSEPATTPPPSTSPPTAGPVDDSPPSGPGIDDGLAIENEWLPDPYVTRVVLAPTAFVRGADDRAWMTIGGGYHEFQFGLGSGLELAVGTLLPVLAFAIVPQVTYAAQVGDIVHIGGHALFAVGGPYLDFNSSDESNLFVAFGGGGVVTIGTPDLFVNVALLGFGGARLDLPVSPAFIPDVSLSARVGRKVRLNAELGTLMSDEFDFGEVWFLMYGIRLFGERLFGDLGFFVPISEDSGDLLSASPLGLPYFSFGLRY